MTNTFNPELKHELILVDDSTGEVLEVIQGIYFADNKAKVTRFIKKNGYQIRYMASSDYPSANTTIYLLKIEEV